MTTATSLFYYNDQLPKVDPRVLTLKFSITGAKTIVPLVPNSAVLTSFDALASQSVIDNFLGTTNEFLVAAFNSTSLGTDAIGIIVNMQGQAKSLQTAKFYTASGTGGTTVASLEVAASSSLTGTSLTNQAACGFSASVTGSGNLAARFVSSGLDSLTAGVLTVDFLWNPK